VGERYDGFQLGPVSRRELVRIGGASAVGIAAFGLGACGSGSGGGGDNRLVLAHWGGSYQDAWDEAWVQPFSKEEDVRAIYDGMDVAKLRSMVENDNVSWDLCCGITPDMGAKEAPELFEPIDYDFLGSSAAGIPDRFKEERRIGFELYAEALGYNTKELKGEPQSWVDFLDVETYPGKRALAGYVSELPLEMALLGDGVPPDQLYPLDLDRALKRLDEIRDQIVFYENVTQAQQLLQDGEVVMAGAPANRITSAIEEGAPVAIQWNQALTITGYNAVPLGAPHKDTAMKLIKYIVDPKRNARMSNYLPIAPRNEQAIPHINPDKAKLLPTYGDRPEHTVESSKEYYIENLEEATRKYDEWLSS
jgi:putative spermidine/putrescine transport system substrate-binding protein